MYQFQHYFIDVIKNSYFQFSGRATRSEFWYFVLFSILLSFLLGFLGTIFGIEYVMQMESLEFVEETGALVPATVDFPINLLQVALSLLLFFPSLAIAIRRLHDSGRSGWWYLIGLVPLIGAIVLLIFFIFKSEEHDNEYGSYSLQ